MKKVCERLLSLSDEGIQRAGRKHAFQAHKKEGPVASLWWTNRHPTQGDNSPSGPAEQEKETTWHPGKGRVAGKFQGISHSSIFTPSGHRNGFGLEVSITKRLS
jgi:hypothetical protein